MDISKEHSFPSTSAQEISDEKIKSLWEALENKESKDLSLSKLLYFCGALIAIAALPWIMSLSWGAFGGSGIFLSALLYALAFTIAGAQLWRKEELKFLAGLSITMAVCMAPIAIYGLESFLGFLPQKPTSSYHSFDSLAKSRWIWMEMGMLLAGVTALKFFPFPLLTVPIYFSAWLLSTSVIPLLLGRQGAFELEESISVAFGLILIGCSYCLDLRKLPRYGFWGYLFGALIFWWALTALCFGKSYILISCYLAVNIAMIVISVLLKRRVLMIFGAIGIFIYCIHLTLYRFPLLFILLPFFVAPVLIYLGVVYQRNSKWVERKMVAIVPKRLRHLIP